MGILLQNLGLKNSALL